MKNEVFAKNLKILANLFIIIGIVYLLYLFSPILIAELKYQLIKKESNNRISSIESSMSFSASTANIISFPPLKNNPQSTEFGIVIDKIDVNAAILPDIDITTKEGYWQALKDGVAHAKGSQYPGQYGNTYLFAHSTVNPLDISKYNAVFTLLDKLETQDRITLFYKGTRYDYLVSEKKIVDPKDISPLTATYNEPTVTLQTCYPPGTNIKRLIIIATIIKN